ncbi:hypothetical protein LINPERHAP1_LOCUS38775 [Linum perenne]
MHDIAAMSYMRYNINNYVDKWYSVELAKKAYTKGIPALLGREDWKEVVGLPILRPLYKVIPGRPKKEQEKGTGGNPYETFMYGSWCDDEEDMGYNALQPLWTG